MRQGGFNMNGVVSMPPRLFSTHLGWFQHHSTCFRQLSTRPGCKRGVPPPRRKWASKVCPPIFFLFVLSNPPTPKLQHTDATRRVEPFSSCFCYSHSTRREGVYPSR